MVTIGETQRRQIKVIASRIAKLRGYNENNTLVGLLGEAALSNYASDQLGLYYKMNAVIFQESGVYGDGGIDWHEFVLTVLKANEAPLIITSDLETATVNITYQIDFEGCPGSIIDGFMGTTTGAIQINTGTTQPYCEGDCPEDQECELVVTYNEDGSIDICCQCMETVCDCTPGNSNGDLAINILDITYVIAYLYKGGPAPTPYMLCSGDPTCNCGVNILDITYLIAYLYKGGPAPCDCPTWLSSCGPPLR